MEKSNSNGNGKKVKDIILAAVMGALLTSGGYQVLWSATVARAEFQTTANRENINALIGLVTETVKQNNQLIAYLEANKR